MAETSSALTELVIAASRGDLVAFTQLFDLCVDKEFHELPSDLQLLDATAVTKYFAANIATTPAFDDKVDIMSALQLICFINGPTSNVDVVIAAGCVEQVVQVGLRSAVARLQEAACCFLCGIAVPHDVLTSTHAQAIISSGAIPLLCQLLSKGKTSTVKEKAAQVLWMLEYTARFSTLPALVAAKAAKPLTELLASLDARVLRPAAGLLNQLVRKHPEMLQLAAKAGAVRHLVVLLGSTGLDDNIPVYACVSAMAQDEQCSRALVAAGALPRLVAAVADAATPPRLMPWAATALLQMAHNGLHAQLLQAGAVQVLVAALRRYDCAAAAAAGAPAPALPAAAGPGPGPASSSTTSSHGPDDAGLAAICCMHALAAMVCAGPQPGPQQAAARQAVITAGGLQQMVRLMRAAEPQVALLAVNNADWMLVKWPASAGPLAEAGAIEALAALLPGSNASDVPAAAAWALTGFAAVSRDLRQRVGQAVCSTAGWDREMLSAGAHHGGLPASSQPHQEPASKLQESGMQLLSAAAAYTIVAPEAVAAGLQQQAVQVACDALPTLVLLLARLPGAAAGLMRIILTEVPQRRAAAVEAGAVAALLQQLQTCADWDERVELAEVLQMLVMLPTGADALVAAGGVQALSAALGHHLQQGSIAATAAAAAGGEPPAAAAAAAGAAGAAGAAAAAGAPAAPGHNDAIDGIMRVVYTTELHEAHTAAVHAALQPLAPQLAQLLAQVQAGQGAADYPSEMFTSLAQLLALLQPPAAVPEAAGPDVAHTVAAAAPTLLLDRECVAATAQTAHGSVAPTDSSQGTAAAGSSIATATGQYADPVAAAAAAAAAAEAAAACARCRAMSGQGGARLQACGRCRAVSYCSKACQRAHWSQHKGSCVPVL